MVNLKNNLKFIKPAVFVIFAAAFFVLQFFISRPAQAATYTVCASGCDYTTITGAMVGRSANDIVTVSSTYVSSTESYPVTIGAGVTLDCQNSGAVIGSTTTIQGSIHFNSTSTLQNCSLANVNLIEDVASINGPQVLSNTFSTSVTTSITFTQGGATNITISGNTNINNIDINTNGVMTISNNTIYKKFNIDAHALRILGTGEATVTSNTFSNYTPLVNSNRTELVSLSSPTTFTSNTISFPVAGNMMGAVTALSAGAFTIIGNNITLPATSSFVGTNLSGAVGGTTNVVVSNNTINVTNGCVNCSAFSIHDDTGAGRTINATTTYNIFYQPVAGGATIGLNILRYSATTTLNLYNDYNGFFNLATIINNSGSLPAAFAPGANSRYTSPYFMTDDADGSNDNNLAPFSNYLDVNGSIDIGVYSAARRNTMAIDDTGTIDYSAVDATTTKAVNDNLRTGDTVTFAAGTYSPLTASSTWATSSITVSGAGANTIFNATSTDAIYLNGVSNSAFSNLLAQNAASSTYNLTNSFFSYGGNSYDRGDLFDDIASSTYVIIDASCNFTDAITTDGFDATTIVGAATSDWHLALVNVDSGGGARLTFFVPNNFFSDPATLASSCTISLEATTVVDRWVTSTFSVSGGNFTYNSSAVSDAGVTLYPGLTDPPALTRNYKTGFKLINSSNNTFTNVTSTGNGHAVWFNGTSVSNSVSSSVFESSASRDVQSDSAGTNSLYNTSFTRASSTITGVGNVDVYFRARALVQTSTSTPLVGVTTTFKDSTVTATTTLFTGADGYTSYTDNLFAFVLSSSSIAETNGGYNPFTVAAEATSTYNASSTSSNLNTVNQTYTLTLAAAEEDGPVVLPPTAPINFVTTTINTSSVSFTWTDTASSTEQEDNFIFDYVTSTNEFPGVTSSIAQDATSTTITGLLPNTLYTFRIAAQNASGTSAYSTTTAFYTLANPPASLSIPDATTNTADLTWEPNSNPSGTAYKVWATGIATTTVTSTDTGTVSTTVTGLTPNTTYTYYVLAQNGDGIQTTPLISSEDTTPAAVPGTPVVTSVSTSTLTVTWASSSNPGTTVYYLLNSDATFSTTTALTTNLTGLTPNTQYQFQVRAEHLAAPGTYSDYSASSTATTTLTVTTVPTAPSDLATTSVSTSSVALSWTDNSSGDGQEDNFILDYVTSTNSFPGVTSSIAQNATSITVTGLSPNVQYTFRIAATNSAGTSGYATTSAFYTLANEPTSVAFASPTTSTLSLSFNTNSNSASTTYAIRVGISYVLANGTLGPAPVYQVSSTWGSSITVTGLNINTAYSAIVYARNGSNLNATSNTSTALYTLANSPGTPTIGTAAQTSLPITISTNSNPTSTEYALYNSTSGNYLAASGASNGATAIWQTTSTWGASFSATGLTCANSYSFLVVARNGNDAQTVSSTAASGTTSACTVPASSGGGGGYSPPSITNTTISINNGATQTNNTQVTLTLTASNATQMMVSNDQFFVNTTWETFNTAKVWILTPGTGTKTVYVLYRDYYGNTANVVSDSINLTAVTQPTPATTTPTTLPPPLAPDQPFPPETPTTPFVSACVPRFQILFDPTADNFVKQLAYGAREPAVKTLQNILGNLGYFKFGYTTNNFVTVTLAAVKAFQKAECLPITGVADTETRRALNSIVDQAPKYQTTIFRGKAIVEPSAAPTPTASTVIFRSYLYLGSSGAEVRALQQKLKDLGYFTYPTITGYFGPITKAAVVEFQKAHNLTPYPGWVGPGTRAALNQ